MVKDELVYDCLVDVAHAGKTISYHDLAENFGLNMTRRQDRKELILILSDICCKESCQGRPLLSAVVVMPEIGYPERGFFVLARELCANPGCDDRSYYDYELKRVHEYWRMHIPAKKTVPYMTVKNREVRVAIPEL